MPDNITGKIIVISGAIRAALTDHTAAAGLAQYAGDIVGRIGVPASTMADTAAFAISRPDDVDVNEILFFRLPSRVAPPVTEVATG